MGGVGKSAVTLALCARAQGRQWWRRRRRRVWWISAADQASLTAGLIGVTKRIGGSEQDLRLIT